MDVNNHEIHGNNKARNLIRNLLTSISISIPHPSTPLHNFLDWFWDFAVCSIPYTIIIPITRGTPVRIARFTWIINNKRDCIMKLGGIGGIQRGIAF